MGTWTAVGLVAGVPLDALTGSPSVWSEPPQERSLAAPEAPGADRRQPQKSRITYHVRARRSPSGFRRRRNGTTPTSAAIACSTWAAASSRTRRSSSRSSTATWASTLNRLPTSRARRGIAGGGQLLRPRTLHAGAWSTSTIRSQAVREFHRVTSPGGRVLASTHGVQVYHPSPADYWRWTHAGLELMFERSADWESVAVTPVGGAATRWRPPRRLRRPALPQGPPHPLAHASVWTSTLSALLVDRAVPSLREPIPGSLHLNFHVVADKPR